MDTLKHATILLVDDDIGDQKLIKKSLSDQRVANHIYTVESGEEALDYLARSKNEDDECPTPHVILLDLNMPGMGGKEFLRRVKASDDFNSIPVVVLTTSDSENDILESYKLQAAGYIKKPVSMEEFGKILSGLEEYWFIICKQVSNKTGMVCMK